MGLLAESKRLYHVTALPARFGRIKCPLTWHSRRRAISKDPNNTKWTRDTSKFGQKMLRAQGWEPGQYLGAQKAAHSGMHSAASASYIRVALKDDLTGLGFNQAKLNFVTGLDVFTDLLSRLNGKSSEDIEGDRQTRLMTKTHMFVEQKWGPMRFVRGGLLVGENIVEHAISDADSVPFPNNTQDDTKDKLSKKEKKSKKRKHAELDATNEDKGADVMTERKRRKAERRANKAPTKAVPDSTEQGAAGDETKEQRKRARAKKKKALMFGGSVDGEQQRHDVLTTSLRTKSPTSKPTRVPCASPADEGESREATKSKKKSKQKGGKESREAKKEKGQRPEAERRKASGNEQAELKDDVGSPAPTIGILTPAGRAAKMSTPMGGRNFARSRFLAAKRQAMLDSEALNQIFMVQS